MRRLPLLLISGSLLMQAQQTVAPTTETVGSPRGENKSGYNIVQSYEFGYRFREVDGDYARYRSDVNFGNGIRLLASKLSINSREGHGRFFDEITLTTQGLGNDPYQFANLRVQKNRFFRYDMLWRLTEYYNPGLEPGISHLIDTRRRLQDHDFTFFPQAKLRFFFGFSRNTQTGPALSSIQAFDTRGDEFPLFTDVRRRQNEYRLGAEVEVSGMRLNFMHGWENFEENTANGSAGGPGANPRDLTTLTQFLRTEPYRGDSPFWRLTLVRDRAKWAANARYTNVSGRRDFVLGEFATGTDRLGTGRNRQVVVSGDGRRPVAEGALTLSFFPTEKLTIANHTAFYNTRMDGDNQYREVNNAIMSDVLINFRFLGIRTISNATDVTYAATQKISLYGGYHFSTRRIRSNEGQQFLGDAPSSFFVEQENTLHSGLAGVRLRPVKPLTISFDGEIGRADKPIYPISEKNYHGLGARAWWKGKTFHFSAQAKNSYNFNSVSLFAYSARARQYMVDGSWMPIAWFGLDASYTKQHLDTATGVAYFSAGQSVSRPYYYISNIHTGYFGAHFTALKRADVYLGFSRVQDTGGRPRSQLANVSDPFFLAQNFPLTFQSPQARVSIKIRNKVRWNAGYQYYSYGEEFIQLFPLSNYHAHTGYTSVLWSF